MADLADHAYAHAAAVLGEGERAVEAALVAVRRGGRSRSAVLGHARAEVLAGSGADGMTSGLDEPAPDDLTELARVLASTRSPLERAIVDLDTRHGLDRGRFARALGTSTANAEARASAVTLDWRQALDPVVLARLGPGECGDLAALLRPAGEAGADEDEGVAATAATMPTLRDLLAIGPSVAEHAESCATCRDRLRSMVSVRTLVGQRALEEAPQAVRAAAAPSRLRRPAPPPALEPVGQPSRWVRPLASVAIALAVVVGGAALVATRSDDGPDEVDALTRVPLAGSVLDAQPPTVEGSAPSAVRLTNRSEQAIDWVAVPDETWISVSPVEGRLGAGDDVALRVVIGADAPEGEVRGAVQITGADGSATIVVANATIEHPPDVAATVQGCAVEAMVEDEGEVRAVELHWLAPPERVVPLPPNAAGYSGELPNASTPLVWWVTATDARGNQARTPDQILPPSACPSEGT